jgi:dolichyl-phosphate-mannose-protein mannosyltransferase
VPVGGQQQPSPAELVTPQASMDQASLHREEKVEYRDQDGNLLNEEQVAELDGKVSFQTRYETRTRVLDADGNEVEDSVAGLAGTAPPPPADLEPETAAEVPEDDGREYPATASPEDDLHKEKSVKKNDDAAARPASEANDATR